MQHLRFLKWVQRLKNKHKYLTLTLCNRSLLSHQIFRFSLAMLLPWLFCAQRGIEKPWSGSSCYWFFVMLAILEFYCKADYSIRAKRWHSNSNNNGLWPDLKDNRVQQKDEVLEQCTNTAAGLCWCCLSSRVAVMLEAWKLAECREMSEFFSVCSALQKSLSSLSDLDVSDVVWN